MLVLPKAQAQCSYPPEPGVTPNFRVFIPNTTQELPFLCPGTTVELRDASGRTLDPLQVYYKLTDGTTCFPAFSFLPSDATNTLVIPANQPAGTVRIHQLTPKPNNAAGGVLFVREFQVRPRPTIPPLTLNSCGVGRDRVQVRIPPQSGVQYFVQIGNGPRSAGTPDGGIYPTNGATTLTVFANYTDFAQCESASSAQPIPTTAPQRPVLQQLQVRGTNLEFTFAAPGLQPQFTYQLLQGTTAVATVPVAPSFTLTNGALSSCYTLQLRDACGDALFTSDALCPVSLTATAGNRRTELTWNVPGGSALSGFDIRRDDQLLASVGPGVTAYTDSLVTCGRSYRYRVVAKVGSATSVSDEKTATTVATSPPVSPQLTASFTLTNSVELAFLRPARDTADRLLVQRTLGGSAPQDVALGRRAPFLDQPGAVSLAQVPCYTGRFRDPCGTLSAPGPAVCPPVLEARSSDRDGNDIQLRWSAPTGQGSGWTYRLLLIDAQGRELVGTPLPATATDFVVSARPSDPQILRYRLEATAAGTGTKVFSNVAQVQRTVRIVVPTAFTPNGDGNNDILTVKGLFLTNLTFTIYDRNGVVVFRGTERNQGWDGRINGIQAAPQVFSYQVDVLDETGRRVTQRGTVTLLR
ncbi:T9SS type B sorting domain-containing protein [Hymenobacter koreensis]